MGRRCEGQCVKCRDQGGTLTASGDIGAAKIDHHIMAGAFSQSGTVDQLQGIAAFRAMPYGLSVGANDLRGALGARHWSCATVGMVLLGRAGQKFGDHLGIEVCEIPGGLGCPCQFI